MQLNSSVVERERKREREGVEKNNKETTREKASFFSNFIRP